jgi:hypothetical protein
MKLRKKSLKGREMNEMGGMKSGGVGGVNF